jgi:hypothetical protein
MQWARAVVGGVIVRVPVLVEKIADQTFRATSSEPFVFRAEGATRDEALQKLRESIHAKLTAGAEITHLDVAIPNYALLRFAGTLDANDPVVQAWEQAMKDYRKEVEEDPDYL